MKINTISIKQGVAYGFLAPEKPETCKEQLRNCCWTKGPCEDECKLWQHDNQKYKAELKIAESNGIPFEDQTALTKIIATAVYQTNYTDKVVYSIPEIEAEEIRQYRYKTGIDSESWFNVFSSKVLHPQDGVEYRTRLRIKSSEKESESEYKCRGCGISINKGENDCFGCCDECWAKKYPKVEEESQIALWREAHDLMEEQNFHTVKNYFTIQRKSKGETTG